MREAEAHALLSEMRHRLAAGPHAALGVPAHATAADIRRAFLELTKRYHPARFGRMSTDTQRLANEVFLELRAAYDTIAKPPTSTRSSGVLPVLSTPARNLGGVPVAARASASGPVATAAMPPLLRPPAPPNGAGASSRLDGAAPGSPALASSRPAGPVASTRPSRDGGGARTPRPTLARAGSPATPTARPPAPRTPTSPRGVPAARAPTSPHGVPAARAPTPSGAFARVDPQLATIHDLLQRQQWEPARAQLHTLAARGSDPKLRALLHYSYGREAQLAHRLDEARVELDTALQLDPDLQLAKVALAELFTRRR